MIGRNNPIAFRIKGNYIQILLASIYTSELVSRKRFKSVTKFNVENFSEQIRGWLLTFQLHLRRQS